MKFVEWRFNGTQEVVYGGMALYSSTMKRWFRCDGRKEFVSLVGDVVTWIEDSGERVSALVTDNAGAPPVGWAEDSFSAHIVSEL